MFAAVFPHSDDFTIFVGGTLLKMIHEGYKGYFIRLTNDEKDSYDLSIGETIYRIEQETRQVAELFGIEKVYDFNYKNHYMDYTQLTEIRHRLITLFRFLKVDTVISFDPWGHYEENPEHYLTGKIVEAACWMAGRQSDLPEHKDMNLLPHFVTEKYYVARGPQLTNRVIDISPVLDIKRKAIALHATPMDNMWKVYLEKHPNGSGRIKTKEAFMEALFITEFSTPLENLQYNEKFHYIGPSEY
ncbi:PIG-L deacetylase family protein [Paenibacillus sp. HJGM_3]|uniref:PIG-L deacetylase family protein n=1 Tax=Paenibacillus sp. HJGM_3 TaxID=3379816 RepID=UPI00385F8902